MSALAGARVLVTRPAGQVAGLADALAALGAVPVLFPTAAIVPDAAQLSRLDAALRDLPRYAWLILTSQNAVALVWERLGALGLTPGLPEGVRVAAVGAVTAAALRERGAPVHAVPDEFTGDAIPAALGDVRGARIFLPRAQAARAELVSALTRLGAAVDEIPLYHTVTAQPDPAAWAALDAGVDYVTFTSASTVHGFFDLLGERAARVLGRARIACIGPITAAALEGYGFSARIVAAEYTAAGLVRAIRADAEPIQPEERP